MIAADADVIYGLDAGMKIRGFSRGDAKELTIASPGTPKALAIDETSVYWIERPKDGWIGVRRAPKAGGEDVALAQLDEATDLAVHGDTVLVRSGPNLVAISKAGGKPSVLVHTLKDRFGAIALDDTALYWVDASAIWHASLNGDHAEVLVPDHDTQGGLVIDANRIYWAEAGKIFAAPLRGHGRPVELARGKDEIAAIAGDDTHIYWVAQNDRTAIDDILRVAKRGGAVEPVALGELGRSAGPTNNLVVDAGGVTVATLDGRLLTYPKHTPGKARRPAIKPDPCN